MPLFQIVNLNPQMLNAFKPGPQGNNENGTAICPTDNNGICRNNGVGQCECTTGKWSAARSNHNQMWLVE
eukprot:CAMPEP_0179440132 /NCGR_PEP_ID=MMETSP0799-20121207/23723_1 /TAXON_ID=46947 /ORGANISM="Geminigera cryophila, Strain CCMP2564" /LENGTH=69 /DNA_ID=CAMNT_0021223159 /DNA_START=12 /DNA_END=221 /DNA_ORIENTATION=-